MAIIVAKTNGIIIPWAIYKIAVKAIRQIM
jgi:hypothetical protein